MDLSGIPTPKFDWESTNLPEQWRKFKSHIELIFDGPLKEKSEEVKVNYLLLWIGDKGRKIRETWTDLDGSCSELLVLTRIKFNKDKLEVGVTEVKYFGHVLTDKGLKPDPDKVRAVQSMKLP